MRDQLKISYTLPSEAVMIQAGVNLEDGACLTLIPEKYLRLFSAIIRVIIC